MVRFSPFVAWCCGTTASAMIAWFGVAGAVSSAEGGGPAIAVPVRAESFPTVGGTPPRGAPSTVSSTATTPSAKQTPDATGGTPRRSAKASSTQPTPAPDPDESATPTPSDPPADPSPTGGGTDRGEPRLVTRTVKGGSAVLEVAADGVTLVSATPAPGYTGRAVRRVVRGDGQERGSLEITFTGKDRSSWILATWDGRTAEVTTSQD